MCPAPDQIPAELVKAGGEMLYSGIRRNYHSSGRNLAYNILSNILLARLTPYSVKLLGSLMSVPSIDLIPIKVSTFTRYLLT
jgi:hypothetical protein